MRSTSKRSARRITATQMLNYRRLTKLTIESSLLLIMRCMPSKSARRPVQSSITNDLSASPRRVCACVWSYAGGIENREPRIENSRCGGLLSQPCMSRFHIGVLDQNNSRDCKRKMDVRSSMLLALINSVELRIVNL